jgi:hypothetical protein
VFEVGGGRSLVGGFDHGEHARAGAQGLKEEKVKRNPNVRAGVGGGGGRAEGGGGAGGVGGGGWGGGT